MPNLLLFVLMFVMHTQSYTEEEVAEILKEHPDSLKLATLCSWDEERILQYGFWPKNEIWEVLYNCKDENCQKELQALLYDGLPVEVTSTRFKILQMNKQIAFLLETVLELRTGNEQAFKKFLHDKTFCITFEVKHGPMNGQGTDCSTPWCNSIAESVNKMLENTNERRTKDEM
eukprot:TRINITY_DN1303_c0_g2_i2.p1 TRINITY_DN1303_c0_g2~~TRINITY_DN1303_c0_g2_i2.p1  ORF type:complete len:174 (+),score=28.72 TRINITY_DN1303_c0_g2_i2:125-646(+)